MYALRETMRRIAVKDERSTWREHAAWLVRFHTWVRAVRAMPEADGNGDFIAILSSFKRPANIDPIVRSLLAVPSVRHVILTHNNPAVRIEPWLRIRSSRLTVLRQSEPRPTTWRWKVAIDHPAPSYLVVDDDLFLLPSQMERLCGELRNDPAVPHGIFGQIWQSDGTFEHAVHGRDCTVDILNRVFACSRAHMERYFTIVDELGMQNDPTLWQRSLCDDMILSFTGAARPRIHDVGFYLDCPTEGHPQIASWRAVDFFAFREIFYQRLTSLTAV